jgi:mono/diheme cytochrome c family protein
MKRRGKCAVAAAIVFLAMGATAAGWYIRNHGFSARGKPTNFEAFIARHLRYLAVPQSQRNMENPEHMTPENLSDGRAHFADHCAICHGNDGRGQTEIGQNLYPKAPDMRQSVTQSLSDGELFYIIHNGVRFTGMPAWGEDPPEKDMDSWKLVRFIRHLPEITAEEQEIMKKLNPKSPAEMGEEEEMRKFLYGDDTSPADESHKHH